jgi:hypothetical protein
MLRRSSRAVLFPVLVALVLAAPLDAATVAPEAACAALENSVLPAPEWYADRCLGGAAVRDHSEYKEVQGLVPGDIAFYKRNFPAPLDVKTAPLATLNFTTVGANAQPLFAMTFNRVTGTLYAIDNTTRQLGTVNQFTGAFTSIGAMGGDPGANFTVLGMAFDPTGGPLEAYVALSNGNTANLYRINVSTAALTLVAPIASFPLTIDIVIDGTGQMFGFDIVGDQLIRINKATGATTIVGPSGIQANFAQGMMYDPSDDSIYGCSFVTVPAQQGILVKFSKTTGAATQLAGPVPDEMECAIGTHGSPCPVPFFMGIGSATNGETTACSVALAWVAGTACPSTTLKYNVYRSTAPGTPPSASTLLQTCVTGLGYTDTTAVGGTRYYYRVRAEDNTTAGNGPCNGGRQDSNLVESSATPTGPFVGTPDDVEGGAGNWDTSGGSGPNPWAIVTTQAHSPTHSWFVADPAVASDQRLRMVAPLPVAAGAELRFWHAYAIESLLDGSVLEYSLDGGTTWSDILLGQGAVPANPGRIVQNGYNVIISTIGQNPLVGRRAWSGIAPLFRQVRVDLADLAGQLVTFRFRFGSANAAATSGVWIDDVMTGVADSCTAVPAPAATPEALAVDAAGDGVFQPNETAVVSPTWRNTGQNAISLGGALTNHTGPAGATYTIPDGAASYGSIAVGGSASCVATGNCYSVSATAPTRPATHWDSSVVETVFPAGAAKAWTLHVGDSFTDVPRASGFYRFVETIVHKNVTGGCGTGTYCPAASTTRAQMAVFVLVAKEVAGFNPPACVAGSELFNDVPATSPFCKWVEELARRGVVSGCGNGSYCPSTAATRDAMSVFVLRTLLSTLNPPACVAGSEMFADLPSSSPFCRWVEELVRRGVVTGCGGGNYCPGNPVTREQMGVFLTVTFGLTLYGL